MPHLSPMFWLISPILFLMLLVLLMSSLWWTHFPNFKDFSSNSFIKPNLWTWK